jgi:hypothetical protein
MLVMLLTLTACGDDGAITTTTPGGSATTAPGATTTEPAGGGMVTGEAEVIAALTAGCEDGDYIMCDVLYQAAPFDSELETYADTCGNRTSGEGFCATEFDVDIDLDALETECLAGDMFSCDQLYIYTPIGSPEEEIGRSCGGLERESRTCVVDHGLDLG